MVLVFFFSLILVLAVININIYIDFAMYEKNKALIRIKINNVIRFKIRLFFVMNREHLEFKIIRVLKKHNNKELFNLRESLTKKKKKKKNRYLSAESFQVKKFNLNLQIGLSDAFNTAMVCGYVSALLDIGRQIFKAKNNQSEITSTIVPCYNSPKFNMSFICIISFKLANIISKFVKSKFKNK